MSNLDTTTPMSEFNVVDENGNTTAVPLSVGDKLYKHTLQIGVYNKANDYVLFTLVIDNKSSDVITKETLEYNLFGNANYNHLLVPIAIQPTIVTIDEQPCQVFYSYLELGNVYNVVRIFGLDSNFQVHEDPISISGLQIADAVTEL